MKQNRFPFLALPVAVVLSTLVAFGSQTDAQGQTTLPLLMLLLASELGFIVSLAGTIVGGLQVWKKQASSSLMLTSAACLLLALAFAWLGVNLWAENSLSASGP